MRNFVRAVLKKPLITLITGFILISISLTVSPTIGSEDNFLLHHSVDFLFLVLGVIFWGLSAHYREKEKLKFVKFLIGFGFFPFILLNQIIQPKKVVLGIKKRGFRKVFSLKSILVKSIASALASLLALLWIVACGLVLYIPPMFLGVVPTSTDVVGESMLPTFKNDETVDFYSYNKLISYIREIKKEDLVIFQSGNTADESGNLQHFVKRVIAIEGDELEIGDGFIYVNGQFVEEPYTNKPRSTFGGTFLEECKSIKVPNGYVFVLGDNRKKSEDSRNLGFISLNDINAVLPYPKQDKYEDRWRDASLDKSHAGLFSFNKDAYYELLNEKRIESKLKPLKNNAKLEAAAKKRASAIIELNEINVKPEDSNYPMEKALREAGYYNTIYGEIVGYGYYDAQELLDYWLEFQTKESVLNKEYQDTGVAAVVGKINDCETQVIVQEFGAYIPPNYSQELISGWESTLNSLKRVLPSWENIKNYPTTYSSNKQDADRILEIMRLRISRIEIIVLKMKASKWLTNEENNWTYEDEGLYNEQVNIAERLNSQVWR